MNNVHDHGGKIDDSSRILVFFHIVTFQSTPYCWSGSKDKSSLELVFFSVQFTGQK
jgi:hypothetical protein